MFDPRPQQAAALGSCASAARAAGRGRGAGPGAARRPRPETRERAGGIDAPAPRRRSAPARPGWCAKPRSCTARRVLAGRAHRVGLVDRRRAPRYHRVPPATAARLVYWRRGATAPASAWFAESRPADAPARRAALPTNSASGAAPSPPECARALGYAARHHRRMHPRRRGARWQAARGGHRLIIGAEMVTRRPEIRPAGRRLRRLPAPVRLITAARAQGEYRLCTRISMRAPGSRAVDSRGRGPRGQGRWLAERFPGARGSRSNCTAFGRRRAPDAAGGAGRGAGLLRVACGDAHARAWPARPARWLTPCATASRWPRPARTCFNGERHLRWRAELASATRRR